MSFSILVAIFYFKYPACLSQWSFSHSHNFFAARNAPQSSLQNGNSLSSIMPFTSLYSWSSPHFLEPFIFTFSLPPFVRKVAPHLRQDCAWSIRKIHLVERLGNSRPSAARYAAVCIL